MMIQDKVKEGFDTMRSSMGRDEILAALGLERKRTILEAILPAAGVFVAGLLVGTSVALLITPKSGRELRSNLKSKANELGHRLGTTASKAADSMRHSLEGDDRTMNPENGAQWAQQQHSQLK